MGPRRTYLRWTPQRRARSPLGACQGRTGSAQGSGVLIWVRVARTSAGPFRDVPGAHWERARSALGTPRRRGSSFGPRMTYLRWTPQKRARSPLGACQERTGSAQEQGVLIWMRVARTSAGPLRSVPGAHWERARSALGAHRGRGVLIWVCVARTSAGPLRGVPGAHWERARGALGAPRGRGS